LPFVLPAHGQQWQETVPVGPIRSSQRWPRRLWTSPDITSFYLIHNFDKHASYRDVGAACPNGLKAHVRTRIHRRGIHSRIYQYDIRHHSNGNSNSATDEYHLHVNLLLTLAAPYSETAPVLRYLLWCFGCRLQEPHKILPVLRIFHTLNRHLRARRYHIWPILEQSVNGGFIPYDGRFKQCVRIGIAL